MSQNVKDAGLMGCSMSNCRTRQYISSLISCSFDLSLATSCLENLKALETSTAKAKILGTLVLCLRNSKVKDTAKSDRFIWCEHNRTLSLFCLMFSETYLQQCLTLHDDLCI